MGWVFFKISSISARATGGVQAQTACITSSSASGSLRMDERIGILLYNCSI